MLIAALILGLGPAGAGFLIGRGFEHGRRADRYVTVKGLAETFVTADLAVWRCASPRPATTSPAFGADRPRSGDRHQLPDRARDRAEAVQPQRVEVTDLLAQPYGKESVGANRFILWPDDHRAHG